MDIMVDIICCAFNHEKYIRRTLDGFLSQKTSFKYRILINDDASTDKTADVIREYEEKYPDIIFPVYQKENQYSKGIRIAKTYLVPKITAKYVALCEGDDYWVDENKLQMQVDALENHLDCYMCVHKTQVVYEDDTPINRFYPMVDLKEGVISSFDFLKLGYGFQTSSYMFRAKEYVEYNINAPEFEKVCDVGDEVHLLYFGQLGNVYYVDKTMSHYRRGVPTSWTVTQAAQLSTTSFVKHQKAMFQTYLKFGEYTNERFIDAYIPRMSTILLRMCLLEKKAYLFFKKENRRYFKILPNKVKFHVVFAVLFPTIEKKRYIRILTNGIKKRGYL